MASLVTLGNTLTPHPSFTTSTRVVKDTVKASNVSERALLASQLAEDLLSFSREPSPSPPTHTLEKPSTFTSIFKGLFNISLEEQEPRTKSPTLFVITSQPALQNQQCSDECSLEEKMDQLKHKVEAYSLLSMDSKVLESMKLMLKSFESVDLEKADPVSKEAYKTFLSLISVNIQHMQTILEQTDKPLRFPKKTAMTAHAIANKHIVVSNALKNGEFAAMTYVNHEDGTSYIKKRLQEPSEKLDIEKMVAYLLPPHENVVEFLGTTKDHLLMEHVPRGDLLDVIETTTLSEHDIHVIAKGLATGIAYLHALGIIHADLKLENVLLGPNNVPKITDFGLSTFHFTEDDKSLVGSIDYIAPEVLLLEKKDAKIDVWSYSCILFALMHPSPFYASLLHELHYPESIYNEYTIEDLSALFRSTDKRTLYSAIQRMILSLKPHELSEILKACFIVKPTDRSNMENVLKMFAKIEKL